MKRILQQADYEVVLAADGQEAIERFVPEQIDLLVLDLDLPNKNGWEAFEELARKAPYIPIVIVTGLSDQYYASLAAGVGALLEKPVEAPVLLKVIEELLAEPKANRLLRLSGCLPDTRFVPSSRTMMLLRSLDEPGAMPRRSKPPGGPTQP